VGFISEIKSISDEAAQAGSAVKEISALAQIVASHWRVSDKASPVTTDCNNLGHHTYTITPVKTCQTIARANSTVTYVRAKFVILSNAVSLSHRCLIFCELSHLRYEAGILNMA